jgi:hypothetical protein
MPPQGGFFMPFSPLRQQNFSANCMKYRLSIKKFQAEIATILDGRVWVIRTNYPTPVK